MLRFVGLRPKLYYRDYEWEAHFDCKNGVEKEVNKPMSTSIARVVLDNKVTAKGVKVNAAKKLSFDDYGCCLSSLSPKCVIPRELVQIFIRCLRMVQRRLDYLPLILKGGYAFGHWKTEL